ncbi:MAG: hypothetical protein MUP70_17085 [Candidatus Aminicenantes bacterium]|nr:hypothetical protein [Candidatus Aminicenantes bacterium]
MKAKTAAGLLFILLFSGMDFLTACSPVRIPAVSFQKMGKLVDYGIEPKTPGVIFVSSTLRFRAYAVFSDLPEDKIDVTDKIQWENGPRFQKFEPGTFSVCADFRPFGGEIIFVNIKVVEE